jgi:hypothetical protein
MPEELKSNGRGETTQQEYQEDVDIHITPGLERKCHLCPQFQTVQWESQLWEEELSNHRGAAFGTLTRLESYLAPPFP